jgi:hypothetical protein
MWYPPGHPAAASYLPGSAHRGSYGLLDRGDPASSHLYDHRTVAGGIPGFKVVPDVVTGHCYYVPGDR